MFDAMSFGSNRIRREWYDYIAAYQSFLDPFAATSGVVDLGEPEVVEERNVGTSGAITSISAQTPIQVTTTSAHGLASNQDVIIAGVVSNVSTNNSRANGRWYITVISSTVFSLNGSVTNGDTGTGGIFSYSSDKFTTVDPLDRLTDRDITDRLLDYVWEEDVFKFRGATTARQLRIQYIASGSPPTNSSTVLGIDNCQNFLETATAGYAAASIGWDSMAARLFGMAYGPKGEGDASGGMLRDFINSQVLKAQRKQRTMGTPRRSTWFPGWY